MTAKAYPHDRFLAATILKLVPPDVTPNQITVTRMFMTPGVLWLLYEGRYGLATPFFLLTAFTDMLDGSLARTRGQVTDWGKLWDPVADKLLIGLVALLLMLRHFPLELAVAVVGIELAFLVGGWYRAQQGIVVSANWWGKLKMLGQVAGVTLFLLFLQTGAASLAFASYVAFGTACALALVSLFRHGI